MWEEGKPTLMPTFKRFSMYPNSSLFCIEEAMGVLCGTREGEWMGMGI
jgi:hypothetical protein